MKKIVFRAYLRQKWINLRQSKTNIISGPFYTYRFNTFYQRKCFVFCDICLSFASHSLLFIRSILERGIESLYFSRKLPVIR